MKKRVTLSVLTISVVVFAILHLYCQLFDPPTAPEKTDVSVIFKASSGQIYKGSLIDSVGKVVEIGAALYLPDNFDSLTIKILDGSSTIMDTTFHSFKVGYFYDTIWVRNTFWTPGGKNVMITPFSRPARLPIIETITIQGVSQNTPPHWSVDTLKKTIKVGTPIFQALSDICTDTGLDRITYALLPGSPDSDTIIGSAYQFNPTLQNVGTFVAQIKASDPAGSFSILPVKITITNDSEDKQPPEITFVTPSDTNTSVTVDSFTINLLCTDASGVAFISAALGTTIFQSNLKNGHYLISVKGFTRGTTNIVTITAKDSSSLGNTNTRKLYFNYSTATPPFTVTYNGNTNTAGAAPVDPGKYEIGATVIVKDNTGNMVKVGYTFIGWNTAADGSGAAYASGATFPIGSGNVTLYAQWTTKPIFTVTYDGNGNTGGTVPADANKYETAADVTVKENTGLLIKSGSTFAGWNTKADGSGTAYSAGVTFPMGIANITLYAQWTVKPTFTVSYGGNGNTSGTVPADSNKYETAANVTVKENTGLLLKTGSTFAGWNSKADGSGTSYAAGVSFPMGNANVTLYAQWTTKPTFTVTYDGNGNTSGIVPTDANKYETAAVVTVKENTGLLIKTGSAFAGWNTAADGSGVVYATGVTFLMGSVNVTLYAQWTLKPTFTVTYNGNGNTGGIVPADANRYEIAATVTVKGNTGLLSRTGFSFNNWNNLQDGAGKIYRLSDTLVIGMQNIQLYAQWAIDSFMINFNSNGGSSEASKMVAYGGYVTEPAVPTKTDFAFAGWYANQALTALFDFTTPITAPRTLFAKWNPIYRVIYNVNGGSGSAPVDNNLYQSGQLVSVLDKPSGLVRQYYDFAGWNTTSNGTGATRLVGTSFQIGTKNDTLYANWQIAKPAITQQPGAITVFPLDSISLSVTANGIGLTYQWQKDGINIPGATNSVFSKQKVNFIDSGYYCCVVNNVNGNTTSSSVKISIRTTVKDADNNEYSIVVIGNQVWMAENLRTTKYNDGTNIPLIVIDSVWANLETPGFCFYANNNDSDLKKKWGALYNWYTVNTGKLAPQGWHVPTKEDFDTLTNYLSYNGYNWDGTAAGENKAAKALSAKSDWNFSTNPGAIGNSLSQNNKSGFSAVPSGARSSGNGAYSGLNGSFYWWLADGTTNGIAWGSWLTYDDDSIYDSYYSSIKEGFSIRCILNRN
jgi:uncharacterized protein (TIGR02145 family)/uncharacterized repeat protein (TIGR02543 family)